MSVKVVSWTQDREGRSLTDLVAYCARVSNPANQEMATAETNERLLKYLLRNSHWSPFEMVSICIEIETTRDIARQILRHRSFSFQEFSQRYAAVATDSPAPMREARLQDTRNRQNSLPTDDVELHREWTDRQWAVSSLATETYQWALSRGIAKEQARSVLPEGLTPSRLYIHGTLRSWIHYISLRTGHGTQLEHQAVARACADSIEPIFPLIREFVDNPLTNH